jgi:gluconokinase
MSPQDAMKAEQLQHIWIVTGPAGSGKTTVAKGLEAELGLPFLEGDDVRINMSTQAFHRKL